MEMQCNLCHPMAWMQASYTQTSKSPQWKATLSSLQHKVGYNLDPVKHGACPSFVIEMIATLKCCQLMVEMPRLAQDLEVISRDPDYSSAQLGLNNRQLSAFARDVHNL